MTDHLVDETDLRIITALRANPRAGVSELSRRLSMARGTVHARLNRLHDRGVITGFGPDLDLTATGFPVRAFTTLSIAQGQHDVVVDTLRAIPHILEVHTVTGPGDILVKIGARSNDHLHQLLQEIADERGAPDPAAGADSTAGEGVERDLATGASDSADPTEACINGADVNDFVALGPQQLEGPGWRWVGAGGPVPSGPFSVVTDQRYYDELWTYLGAGPETEQLAVDFEREVILTIRHGSGVNFGRCGNRFDGFGVREDGVVIIDLFHPGGSVICPASLKPATYAVAIDRSVFDQRGTPVATRSGPRASHGAPSTVQPISFELSEPPRTTSLPEPPPTTAVPPPPPTAPPLDAGIEPGVTSEPAFDQRAGSLSENGYDLPLPLEWERNWATATITSISVVGRGGMSVEWFRADSRDWWASLSPEESAIVEGPTAVSLPLYELVNQTPVTTGEVLHGTEYKYSRADSIVETVVRRFDHADSVIIMAVSYPDFATIDDMIGDQVDDPLMRSLAGLSPQDLLDDVRVVGS